MSELAEVSHQEAAHITELVNGCYQQAVKKKSPQVIIRVAMRLVQDLKKIPFQQIDLALGKVKSGIRLIAWPVESPGKLFPGTVVARIPFIDQYREYPFFLYVTFGPDQFKTAMKRLKTSPLQNFANLKQTGFPHPGPVVERL